MVKQKLGILLRVSSDVQQTEGGGLEVQKKMGLEMSKQLGLETNHLSMKVLKVHFKSN